MRKNTLLPKLALIAAITLVISGGMNIYEGFYLFNLDKKVDVLLKKRETELSLEHQKYLDEAAAGIQETPVVQEVISRIRSDLLAKASQGEFYLWMSDDKGEFVFGLPAPAFIRLNGFFDKYHSHTKREGPYLDRNDFLRNEVERFEDLIQLSARPGINRGVISSIRSLGQPHERRDVSSLVRLVLSASVYNSEGQIIGDLFLKTLQSVENPYRNDFLDEIVFPFVHALLGLSFAVLWFLLPSWVYMDARKRNVRRAFVWAILTLLSLGFACIVYLLVRPQEVTNFVCPECSGELNGTLAFCPHCGRDLSQTICRKCQYPLKPEWQFCPSCRYDTKSETKPVQVSGES